MFIKPFYKTPCETFEKSLAKLLESTVRVLDTVYRYGGEEFLIIMPETDEVNVSFAAERIRSETEAMGIAHPASSAADVLTVSIGHTSITRRSLDSFESWRAVIDEADKALYRAKAAGRNRVAGPIDSDDRRGLTTDSAT